MKHAHHNEHKIFTYPNGLRLITVPMDSTKSVTVLVMVATGSRYETKEINGISHFLEHMMFKGTVKRPGYLDITYELDSIGAESNAFTSKEYTGYYIKCSADNLDKAIDIISDIFQNSILKEEEIDKERGTIKEEINRTLDSPGRYVSELFDELAYGKDHPLGWDIAGEKEVIDNLKRDDFVNYFSSHYFAENTVIAIAGNVDPELTKEKVGKYFNNVRHGKKLSPITAVDRQKAPQLKIFNKKTEQTHINLGFRSFGWHDPRREALKVLSVILGGGMSSRLFVEVREKRGLAYTVFTSAGHFQDTGDFTTYAGLTNKNLVEAVKIILDEHKRLIQEAVDDTELARTKDLIRGRFVIGMEPSDAQASYYADQELLEKKILTPEEKLARVMAVTKEDIVNVAREIFKPERLNLAVVGPVEEDNAELKESLNSW